MKRNVAAAIAGMVVLVVWGMIFWGFLAGPLGVFQRLPNDREVTDTLLQGGATTGTYFMPWPRETSEQFEAFVAQHKRGPFFRLSFVHEGVDPNSPMKLLLGCLHYLLVSIIAVSIVNLARGLSSKRKFLLVFLGGLLGTIFITIGDPVWFHLPWNYPRAVVLYEVISWTLLAATVTRITRTQTN